MKEQTGKDPFLKSNSKVGEGRDFIGTTIYLFLILDFNTHTEKVICKSFRVASLLINKFKDPFTVLRYGSYFIYAHKGDFY